jgi:hypothetical protein
MPWSRPPLPDQGQYILLVWVEAELLSATRLARCGEPGNSHQQPQASDGEGDPARACDDSVDDEGNANHRTSGKNAVRLPRHIPLEPELPGIHRKQLPCTVARKPCVVGSRPAPAVTGQLPHIGWERLRHPGRIWFSGMGGLLATITQSGRRPMPPAGLCTCLATSVDPNRATQQLDEADADDAQTRPVPAADNVRGLCRQRLEV